MSNPVTYLNDKELTEVIVRLFESKCKQYSKTTIKVWIEELKYFPANEIINSVKKVILSPDDFPSIGKLCQNIRSPLLAENNNLKYEYDQYISVEKKDKILTFRDWKFQREKKIKTDIDKSRKEIDYTREIEFKDKLLDNF